ncbi:MAG: 50S ribosomal protein L6, partial [Eubacterium sp.]|nr:50S ribosomal protein L6 [Eubacterium sp.]
MSRIGLKPITIPAGVDVNINANTVTVKGPNGTLSMDAHPNMAISVEGSEIIVSRP